MLNIMAEHRMLTGSATPVNGVKHADDVHVENRLSVADAITPRGSTLMDGTSTATPSRGGTLKKRNSLHRGGSLRRSISAKSGDGGSVKGINVGGLPTEKEKFNNAFYTPIPTTGTPTDSLAERFLSWRKFLKELITYYREIQVSYESRAKAILRVSNVIGSFSPPTPQFLAEGGISDATGILRDYHKQAFLESNRAKEIEDGIIAKLTSLRADLSQKIKEIKALAGDFKNSVEKETEGTRRAVDALGQAIAAVDSDPSSLVGKGDPFVVRLAVERQVERQLDEENYLHRAYFNLEGSGRQLESIVVGEIQKSYSALVGILQREAKGTLEIVEKLRVGPIALARDREWTNFVKSDSSFTNVDVPLRRSQDITYPGKDHPAAAEVRAGMLERKSKYLKSYTPGWYVLSPTHLHEFKSADRINTQPPVMSLYLPDQRLGSRSHSTSTSHKFMLKGRQTGSMHRGHSWVFRAESYETMMAWFEDIRNLTEKSGEERNAFVRQHVRRSSVGSHSHPAGSVSSDGLEEDEDEVPYAVNQHRQMHATAVTVPERDQPVERPSPGGRFPSDVQLNGDLQAPGPPSSGTSDNEAGVSSMTPFKNVSSSSSPPSPPLSPTSSVVVRPASAALSGPLAPASSSLPFQPHPAALQIATPLPGKTGPLTAPTPAVSQRQQGRHFQQALRQDSKLETSLPADVPIITNQSPTPPAEDPKVVTT